MKILRLKDASKISSRDQRILNEVKDLVERARNLTPNAFGDYLDAKSAPWRSKAI